jgi:hypothetical protein
LIVKVKGIKKVKDPVLKAGCAVHPRCIKDKIDRNATRSIPEGFISFEKVKVLE